MNNRYEKIGIKQAVRLEWLEHTLELVMSGVTPKDMREELKAYLANRKDDGSFGKRGTETTNIAITMLMNIWGAPNKEILPFRNDLLKIYNSNNSNLVLNWAMISAAYPFWFKIAEQVGRLLKLQNKITKKQIVERIKELYGDRSSVIRSAQRVIQAFVSWGVLNVDNNCYQLHSKNMLNDIKTISLLYEAALLVNPSGKAQLNVLQNSPAFFPFTLPIIAGDVIASKSEHLNISRYSVDDEVLHLK